MEILKKKLSLKDKESGANYVLLISNNNFTKYNVAKIPLERIAREGIKFDKEDFLFPTMVNENKARNIYNIN
jgi:hypothetical protein